MHLYQLELALTTVSTLFLKDIYQFQDVSNAAADPRAILVKAYNPFVPPMLKPTTFPICLTKW